MKKTSVDGVLLIVVILFSLIGCSYLVGTPSPTPFPANRKVVAEALTLQEKWRVKSGQILDFRSRHTVEFTSLGLLFANADQHLVLLDSMSGQIAWQTEYDGHADSLVADAQRAYLASGWRVHAYSLDSGQLLWQTDEQTTRRGYDLYLRDGVLFEYEMPFREGEIIHKFDPQTGLKLEDQVRPVTEEGPWFHRPLGEGIDLRMDKKALWAVERETGKELWHIARFGFGEVATPAIVDHFLAISCDSELRVLKLSSGEVVWGISGIVSNPVVLEDKVYVIANDASIRVHDLKTGRKLGVLKLEPAVTDSSRYSYALVASEASQMIYAYYGDSQEIIAFGN